MLPAQQEDYLLRDAVRTMMAQICKVGVAFSSDLLIEGTIAITVDRQKVIVIHVDDRLSAQSAAMSHISENAAVTVSSALSADVNAVADGFRSTISELSSRHISSLANQPVKPGWFVGSASSKMMTCLSELSETLNERVAIDVDSEEGNEAFDDIDLGDVTNCNGNVPSSPSTVHPGFNSTTGSGGKTTCRKVKDAKNVIIIEDSELLEPTGDVSEVVCDYGNSELKLLDSFANRCLLPSNDCESVIDNSDSRSILSPGKQGFESAVLCCEMCGWQARNNSQLESHLVTRHGIIDNRSLGRRIAHITCPVCGKRFRFRAQLDKHRLRHVSASAERLHQCLKCRNSYRHAQSLALHSQVHTKGAPLSVDRLSCIVCNKTYANKVLFQKHIVYMHERNGFPDDR